VENSSGTGKRRKKSTADSAEDPLFALQNDLPLDVRWYLNHQLKKPLTQLFSLLMRDAERVLFEGEHTFQTRTKFAPQAALMKQFLVVKQRCMGCNCALTQDAALCEACEPRRRGLLQLKQHAVANLRAKQTAYLDKCIACAGSEQFSRLCRNAGCTTLYERAVTQHNLTRAARDLTRCETAASHSNAAANNNNSSSSSSSGAAAGKDLSW
jgi:DNA polymerase delta subunit 1